MGKVYLIFSGLNLIRVFYIFIEIINILKNENEMKIAVCITVHNRHFTAKMCVAKWKEFLPENATLFVVDDGSKEPFPNADFRFDQSQGIAVAKNKCLELAEDFDYIFLSDDDVWPILKGWELLYINSGLKHACLTFNRRILGRFSNYIEFEKPCGCMLFITKEVLQKVGGWDTEFKGYGYDHVNWSDRIFNNNLTPARYINTFGSMSCFYSLDYNHQISSSVSPEIRNATIHINTELYKQKFNSTEFKPYK